MTALSSGDSLLPVVESSSSPSSRPAVPSRWLDVLDAALLPVVCHFLPSLRALLAVGGACSHFHRQLTTKAADAAAVRQSCWQYCPPVRLQSTMPDLCGVWEDCDGEGFFSIASSKHALRRTVWKRLSAGAHGSSSWWPAMLRSIGAVHALSLRLGVENHRDLALLASIAVLRSVRSLQLITGIHPSVDGAERLVQFVSDVGDTFPLLSALDTSGCRYFEESSRAAALLLPLCQERLQHLTAGCALLAHLSVRKAALPSVVSLAAFGGYHSLHYSQRGRCAVDAHCFPSLRLLYLSSGVELAVHYQQRLTEQGKNGAAWQQVQHLRFNIGCSWLSKAGEDGWLHSLRSLHIDIACKQVIFDTLRMLERVEAAAEDCQMLKERLERALWSCRQLEQLTITADPATEPWRYEYNTSSKYSRNNPSKYEGKDQRFDLPLSLLCLPPLTHLTYLHLDCPDTITEALVTQLLSVADLVHTDSRSGRDTEPASSSVANPAFMPLSYSIPWRASLTHLGLHLHPPQLRAALATFSHTAFPALQHCHIVQVRAGNGTGGGSSGSDSDEEEQLRQLIGDRLWCSARQLMAGRFDEQWTRQQELRISW